jgi:hypothetical protein
MAAPDAEAPREPAIWQHVRESDEESGEHLELAAGVIGSGGLLIVPTDDGEGSSTFADGAVAVALALAGAGVGDVGSIGAWPAHEVIHKKEARMGRGPRRPPRNGSFMARGPRRMRRR